MLFIVGVGLFLLAAGLWYGAGRQQRRQHALQATETVTVADLTATLDAVGAELDDTTLGRVVEVVGKAAPGPVALTSPLGNRACVWYRSTITEHYREYEWRGSEEQKNRRRELVEKTRQLSSECSSDDFVVDDGTGTITVAIGDHEIDDPQKIVDRLVHDDDGWGNRFQVKLGPISLSGGSGEGTTGYHHDEWILAPGAKVFAIGEAHRDGDGVRLTKPKDTTYPFIVSTRSSDELEKSAGQSAMFFRIGTVVAGIAGVACIIGGFFA